METGKATNCDWAKRLTNKSSSVFRYLRSGDQGRRGEGEKGIGEWREERRLQGGEWRKDWGEGWWEGEERERRGRRGRVKGRKGKKERGKEQKRWGKEEEKERRDEKEVKDEGRCTTNLELCDEPKSTLQLG